MFKPFGYYILVEMKSVEKKSSGGIIIHSDASQQRDQDDNHIGVLKALGPVSYSGLDAIGNELPVEERARMWGVKIGDEVQFKSYDGIQLKDREGLENYRLIKDFDVIGGEV